jgi:WD40 repeat protein/class 3 adenylate cyclase
MVASAAEILTFLIADVRGYTSFTQARGDEAAARLAMIFAEIANEAVEARSGRVIQLRGDEALASFASARQALRAAVDLQLAFLDEMELDPAMPLRVGIGIDAGEAVPVSDGYRGGALNLAARLCSKAEAGEVLASQGVLHLARATDGLRFIERGEVEMKGLTEPVRVLQVVADNYQPADISQRMERVSSADGPGGTLRPRTELPPELDPMTPFLGRNVDARWIRWEWRLARRGPWRAVALTGPEGVGKTRLAAEAASLASANGAQLAYAGARDGGRLTEAIRAVETGNAPSLLVLEDLDAATNEDLASVAALSERARDRSGLVVVTAHEDSSSAVMSLLRRLAGEDGIRRLEPLDSEGVREIVDLYASGTDAAAPVQAILEASRGLPAAVHDLAGRWAQSDASRRLGEATSRAAESRTDLRVMESQVASDVVDLQRVRERTLRFGASKPSPDDCPFKGLESFDVADTEFFYGRERLIAEMVARLAGSAFIGIVGPSGSGKSSAVRAGLVPAVGAGVLPGSEPWLRAIMRPGEHPMRSLDRAVYAALPEDVRIDLSGSDDPLRAALERLPEAGRLLLVVDQFEEAFTSCEDEDERIAFFGVLARAARDDPEHVVVVVALRADFYGRCATYPALAELLGPNHVLVGPMTSEEYRRAIEGPARRAGLRIEPALIEALVTEVVDEPGGLPLLSTALVELWGHREGRRISMDAYVRTGGVKGAVARLAERAFEGFNEEQQAVARSVLLRLADAGEGGSAVRRRVPLAEFDAERNPEVARVLDTLTAQRLVTVSEGTVEVAHEALLREWPRLAEWLEEDRAGRRLRRHLTDAAKEWQATGQDTAELYRGPRLASALEWTTEHNVELNELEREFLNAGRSATEREAERQRRTNRRLRGLLAGVGLFLVLALVAGSVAVVQRGRARRSTLVALSQSLGSQGVIEPRLDRGLLLAREAVSLDVSEQTRSTLLATVLRDPAALGVFYGGDTGRRPLAIALSPDGESLAVEYNVQDLQLFDTSSLAPKAAVPLAAGGPPAFSPDGALIAVPSAGAHSKPTGGIDLRDPATGELLRTLPADPRFATATGIDVPEVAFSRDSGELYALVRDFRGNDVFVPETVYIVRWDVTSGKSLGPATNLGDTAASGFGLTADGRLIVSGDRTTIRDARTMALVRTLPVGGSVAMAVSPDGRTMALGDRDGSVRFVNVRTGEVTLGTGGHTARVESVGFTPISEVVTTGDDGQVLVWDVSSHTVIATFAGHGGSVIAQATDGQTLYTASLDGTIFAWDLSGTRRFGRAFTAGSGNESPFWGSLPAFALSADGSTLAVTQGNGYVNLWDLATLQKVQAFRAVARGTLASVNFSPDGKTLVATGTNGQALLWDLTASPPTSIRLTGLPPGNRYSVMFGASFSPDGRTLIAGDWRQLTPSSGEGEVSQTTEGYLATWDAKSGDLLSGPIHLDGGVSQIVFSPDGSMMAVPLADGHVILVDVRTLKVVRTLAADTAVPPTNWASFSPDGKTLATGGWAGVVRLWDVASGRPLLHFLAAAGPLWNVGFDPSGGLLVTSGSDGTTRLWDAATGKQFGASFPGFENVWSASAFTPDGSKIVVVYSNGQAFVWPATWQAWAAHACAVAGRGFTRGEWRTFVGDRPYEPVCSPGSP